nr:MAG TPA_asm: hypothetical protein [Caudoviricetes sp.]
MAFTIAFSISSLYILYYAPPAAPASAFYLLTSLDLSIVSFIDYNNIIIIP